jgi:hypothetical protein
LCFDQQVLDVFGVGEAPCGAAVQTELAADHGNRAALFT